MSLTSCLARLCVALLLTLAVRLAGADAPLRASPDRERIEALAGAPVDAVRFFKVYFWQPLDESSLVVWLGREEPYLVTLRERCNGLLDESVLRLADYKRPGRNMLRTRWSEIVTEDGITCRIGSIRALQLEPLEALGSRYSPEASNAGVRSTADGRRWESLEPLERPARPARIGNDLRPPTSVGIAAEVDQNGRVRRVRVEASSGYNDLDEMAVAHVRRWRFEPHRPGHPPRPVWVSVRVNL